MLRAKSLGAVTFDYTNKLFIKEEFDNGSVLGEMNMSADGTHIVYEASISTPYITLESRQHSIISEAQRVALMTMWETLDTTYTLTYSDDSTDTVRMAKEKKIVFTELWEGACQYRAVIPLAKVS